MQRIALSNEPGDNRFDLVQIVAPACKKAEKATTEDKRFKIAELRQLLSRDTIDEGVGVDLLLLDDVGDRGRRQIALDSLSIEILFETSPGGSGGQDLRAGVLLGVLRVVQ